MSARTTSFDGWLEKQLRDPEFREEYDALEAGYQVAVARMRRGLTQQQLAELVGTQQPSIARLETGQNEPRVSFLRRIAHALGARLEVRLVLPEGEAQPVALKPGVALVARAVESASCLQSLVEAEAASAGV